MTYALEIANGWELAFEEDLVLTPTPRTPCDWTPIQTEPEDLSQFNFTTFTPVVEQTFLEQVHQGLTHTRNGLEWGAYRGDSRLITKRGRYNSMRRNVPYELSSTLSEEGKAWFADIPRGYKGAVKETMRFNRALEFGYQHKHCAKKTDRKVKMELVNKTM